MNPSPELLAQIEQLKEERRQYLPAGSHPGYARLTAQIQYLRHGEAIRAGIYAWRKKNAERIKYERAAGIAYQTPKRTKPYTDEEKAKRNAAVKRHEERNPQRSIRQRIERILHMFYGTCSAGAPTFTKRGKRVEELLGCSREHFREHIRTQLQSKGWLWSEYKTKWTMDHVVPVRNFKLPEEEQACWHYTNLRPLAKKNNHRSFKN